MFRIFYKVYQLCVYFKIYCKKFIEKISKWTALTEIGLRNASGLYYKQASSVLVLKDGFITCSVINTNANSYLTSINNLYEVMPLQIPKMFKNIWLDKGTTIKDVNYIVSKPYITKFKIQRIAS